MILNYKVNHDEGQGHCNRYGGLIIQYPITMNNNPSADVPNQAATPLMKAGKLLIVFSSQISARFLA
jgi:hypothetical protein